MSLWSWLTGQKAGQQVLEGQMQAEQAGDLWVQHADHSHESGVSFMAGYDSTGAPR